jgi:thiamine transport system ATP-binding protein
VHRSHTTAVYVTHDQDEAFTVADTVAIMHDGWLARVGTPQDVWTDPQTVTVARFLGYGPFLEPMQVAQFGIEVPDGKLLACGPDAWRRAADGVPVRIVERRTVRGAEEVLIEFGDGANATVSLPIGTDLEAQINVTLDQTQCALVSA